MSKPDYGKRTRRAILTLTIFETIDESSVANSHLLTESDVMELVTAIVNKLEPE